MSVARKFVGDVGIRTIFQILNAFKGLAFLPFISRQFGADAYAIWSQIIITSTLLTPLVNLRLNDPVVRYLGSSKRRSQALLATGLVTFVMSGLILAVGWFARDLLAAVMFADRTLTVFAALFIGLLLARANLQLILSYFRSVSAIRLFTGIQTCQILAELGILVIVPQFMGGEFQHALLGIILVDTAIAVVAVGVVVRLEGISFCPDWKTIRQFLRYSLPLVATAGLYWVVNSFDRFVIVHFLGLEEVGAYSAAYRVAQVLKFVVQPVSFVLLPMMSRMWERGERRKTQHWIAKTLDVYTIIACPAAVGLGILGPRLVRLLGGGVFTVHPLVFLFLIPGILLLGIYQIRVFVLYLHEKTSWLFWIFAIVAGFNIPMNFWLVPRLGIQGAAITTMLSYMLQVFLLWMSSRSLAVVPYDYPRAAKAIMSSLLMGLILLPFPKETVGDVLMIVSIGLGSYVLLMILLKGLSMEDLGYLMRRARKRS